METPSSNVGDNEIDYNLLQVTDGLRDDLEELYNDECQKITIIYAYLSRCYNHTPVYLINYILLYYQMEHFELYEQVEQHVNSLNDSVPPANWLEENDSDDNREEDRRDAYEDIDDILIETGNGNIRFTRVIINRRLSNSRSNFGTSPPLATSPVVPNRFEDIKITLMKSELNKHKALTFEDVEEMVKADNPKCSICQFEFAKEDKVRNLECNHIFHQDCVDKWLLEYNYKCPMCRRECGSYEPKI